MYILQSIKYIVFGMKTTKSFYGVLETDRADCTVYVTNLRWTSPLDFRIRNRIYHRTSTCRTFLRRCTGTCGQLKLPVSAFPANHLRKSQRRPRVRTGWPTDRYSAKCSYLFSKYYNFFFLLAPKNYFISRFNRTSRMNDISTRTTFNLSKIYKDLTYVTLIWNFTLMKTEVKENKHIIHWKTALNNRKQIKNIRGFPKTKHKIVTSKINTIL